MPKKDAHTLANKIAGILNTAPGIVDPEDEAIDSTSAKVFGDVEDGEIGDEEEILSKFRSQNVDLLADIDTKYAGKKASRKSLEISESEDEALSESENESFGEEDSNEEAPMDEDEESLSGDEEGNSEESTADEDESERSNENSDVDEEESSADSNGSDLEEYGDDSAILEDDKGFKHMSDSSASSQIKKAACVRNQMALWESLLEIRIQMQKCLIASNKMPQHHKFAEFKKEADAEFSSKATQTKTAVGGALDKLLLLQDLLLRQYPETKSLDKKTDDATQNEDDEEIPSDTEPENSDEDGTTLEAGAKKRKRKASDFETDLSHRHKRYKAYSNGVIKKWNEKTRIAVAKTNTPSQSVLNQIEFILSNKNKLVKRTQLRRSQYRILGEESEENQAGEEYSTEIFDDDDFYHQLLRELIEVKSADVTDPVQLGRQWIQLQSLRSKMKKKVDTKATKGRKIRYAVHTKLVNFMAPIDENLWTEEAKTDLYSSLFGKNQPLFST